jgi:hypothetical protein
MEDVAARVTRKDHLRLWSDGHVRPRGSAAFEFRSSIDRCWLVEMHLPVRAAGDEMGSPRAEVARRQLCAWNSEFVDADRFHMHGRLVFFKWTIAPWRRREIRCLLSPIRLQITAAPKNCSTRARFHFSVICVEEQRETNEDRGARIANLTRSVDYRFRRPLFSCGPTNKMIRAIRLEFDRYHVRWNSPEMVPRSLNHSHGTSRVVAGHWNLPRGSAQA